MTKYHYTKYKIYFYITTSIKIFLYSFSNNFMNTRFLIR